VILTDFSLIGITHLVPDAALTSSICKLLKSIQSTLNECCLWRPYIENQPGLVYAPRLRWSQRPRGSTVCSGSDGQGRLAYWGICKDSIIARRCAVRHNVKPVDPQVFFETQRASDNAVCGWQQSFPAATFGLLAANSGQTDRINFRRASFAPGSGKSNRLVNRRCYDIKELWRARMLLTLTKPSLIWPPAPPQARFNKVYTQFSQT